MWRFSHFLIYFFLFFMAYHFQEHVKSHLAIFHWPPESVRWDQVSLKTEKNMVGLAWFQCHFSPTKLNWSPMGEINCFVCLILMLASSKFYFSPHLYWGNWSSSPTSTVQFYPWLPITTSHSTHIRSRDGTPAMLRRHLHYAKETF